MRRTLLLASAVALLAGLVGLVFIFGSALAQPLWPRSERAVASDVASCHLEDGDVSADHMLTLFAGALGMDASALEAELASGKSLEDIAKVRGLDGVQLAAALKTAMQAAMQQHIENGLLTQEQADEMLSHMEAMGPEHFAGMLNGQMPHDMMGGQGHGGMMGGLFNGMLDGFHGMVEGWSHGGMMGGQNPGGMMDGFAPDGGAGAGDSCHLEDDAGQQL